jgi:hypothetical protein
VELLRHHLVVAVVAVAEALQMEVLVDFEVLLPLLLLHQR